MPQNSFTAGPTPNVYFEDNKIGNLKKEVFYMGDDEVDRQLAEFGFPHEPEFGRAGVYIQTTPGKEQEENRKKNDVVLIPIGCTENHGPMNPSGMDTFMVTTICEGVRRYTARQGRPVNIALPPLLYGCHPVGHIGMPETIAVHEETAIKFVEDVMLGLWNAGYRKMILVNNHGQTPSLQAAIQRFAKDYQLPGIYRYVDWHRAVREMFAVKEWGGRFETMFTHACEVETGCGLFGFPDMINMDYAIDRHGEAILNPEHFDASIDACRRPARWEDSAGESVLAVYATPEGVCGDATKATAEKLKRPYLCIMKYIVMLIDEYLEQFPPGTVPDAEKMTLRTNESVAPYIKEPLSEGWKTVYGLEKLVY